MKKAVTVVLAILLGWWLPAAAFSQETLVLSLDESIRLALAQNPFYLATQEKVVAANEMVRNAAANFFPSLNAQGLHTLDEKLFVLEFPSMIPGQPPQRIQIDFTRDYQFSLALSLPLFTGGRLISGFRQAKYNLGATEEMVRQSQQETVYNVKRAFYGYLVGKKFVEVTEEAVALAEKHAKNVQNLYDVGMASRFDLLRSEVEVANLKPQLIRAKNNLDVAELSLKTILGLDLSQPVEIRGDLTYEPFEADVEKSVNSALLRRPEINQLSYQRQLAGEMLNIARASRWPTLAISGAYNFWADAFNFKRNTWQNYYSVNLALTLPIFNGFSVSAQVGQSKAMIREIELNQKGLAEMIKFEVRQAVLNLNQAKESLLSLEKNVEQAQESVRIAELNYSEGLATSLDVSAAQVALTQAKTNYSQALFDYVMSLAELDKAMGLGWEEGK